MGDRKYSAPFYCGHGEITAQCFQILRVFKGTQKFRYLKYEISPEVVWATNFLNTVDETKTRFAIIVK